MIRVPRIIIRESMFFGYTIIELLISLFILTTISSLMIGIIWISLKSTVKTNNLSVIRQNGNFAMLQMTKMLQFSNEFLGVSKNGTTYTINCENPSSIPLEDYNYVKFTAMDNRETILRCSQTPPSIASNSAYLLNTSLFSVNNCNFTCTRVSDGSPYNIGIEFEIRKSAAVNLFDDPAPLIFKNSVTLRNSSNY